MLVRYQGDVVDVVGATRYGLAATLHGRAWRDVEHRRVTAACQWALALRHATGSEPGRVPGEQGAR